MLALTMMFAFIGLVFSGYPIAWILGGLAALFTAFAIIFEVDFAIPTDVELVLHIHECGSHLGCDGELGDGCAAHVHLHGYPARSLGNRPQSAHRFRASARPVRGGLAIAVSIIGVLLAASTGIIGASVVLLGLLGLPVMLENGYDKHLASGTVAPSAHWAFSFRPASCSSSWPTAWP